MKVLALLVIAAALVVIPAAPAHACSCGELDEASVVALAITASHVEIRDEGSEGPWGVVDLRGDATRVLGATPALLQGVDIDAVPVLSSVLIDPEPGASDSCNTPPAPPVGSDLAVTGHASDQDGELVIWTGPCSGTFEVAAAPVAVNLDNDVFDTTGARRTAGTSVLVGGLGLLVVGGVSAGLVWRRRSSI